MASVLHESSNVGGELGIADCFIRWVSAMPRRKTETIDRLNETFELWMQDYREIGDLCHDLIDRMAAGGKRCTDIAKLEKELLHLLSRLQNHFQMELALGRLLTDAHGRSSSEIDATRRQADKDHAVLCDRFERLIERTVVNKDGSDESQGSVAYEFNLIIDVIEQHQELEFENLRSLFPSSKTSLDCNESRV